MPDLSSLSVSEKKPEISPVTPLIPGSMILERPKFAIDEAVEEDEMYAIGGDEDVMDEVDAFLEAHDSGLTDDQKREAQGERLLLVQWVESSLTTIPKDCSTPRL